eukprot:CFRG2704T1
MLGIAITYVARLRGSILRAQLSQWNFKRSCATLTAQESRECERYTKLTRAGDCVGVISLTNSIVGGCLAKDLEDSVNRVLGDHTFKSVILIGDSPGKFLAAPGLELMNADEQSHQQLLATSLKWQEVLTRIQKSSIPFLAVVDGSCEGAGLDLALACHYRIASDSPKTKFSFPEVLTGRLPSGGGTQRLPRTVGVEESLKMLLTGGGVRAAKAKKIRLVNSLVETIGVGHLSAEVNTYNHLYNVALALAVKFGERQKAPKLKAQSLLTSAKEKLMTDPSLGLNLVLSKARQAIKRKTFGNYPAPLAVLDCVEAGYKNGAKAGLELEARSYADLSLGDKSRALQSLMNAQTTCLCNRYIPDDRPLPRLKRVAVLGAGLMGSGIAQVSIAKAKKSVWLMDRSIDAAAVGGTRVEEAFQKQVKRKTLSQVNLDRMLTDLHLTSDVHELSRSDIIIEAVFEDLKIKQEMIRKTEAVTGDDCIFASNTSALPITDIAKASKRPENVIGMHYFSPVPQMPLLEVVTHEGTSQRTTAAAVQVGLDQGKTVIVVKDGPGFYTTRVLAPLLTECMVLMVEGNNFTKIDKLMQSYGFPVGPVTLFDEVGIDVGCHVAADLGQRLPRLSQGDVTIGVAAMNELMANGWTGRKSKKGLYLWTGKKMVHENAVNIFKRHGNGIERTTEDSDIPLRMACRMTNEAVMCLEENVISTPSDGDIGACFGLGFVPFQGGPFRWLDTYGADKVVNHLDRFRDIFGQQFTACDLLRDMAKNGGKFYT